MEEGNVTVLTERGETAVPVALRKALSLHAGQKLHWQQVSHHEFRVEVLGSESPALGPQAMLGYARRFQNGVQRRTSEVMRELREGDAD